jgi:hypothetical protein
MNGLVFVPALLAAFCLLLALLERRERRRQEVELDRLRALLAARNGNGGPPEWLWPATPRHEEEQR